MTFSIVHMVLYIRHMNLNADLDELPHLAVRNLEMQEEVNIPKEKLNIFFFAPSRW